MPPRKSVKKVEISDESVLDLKSRSNARRVGVDTDYESDIAFNISHIGGRSAQKEVDSEDSVSLETDSVISRSARNHRFDPEQLNQRMESFAEKLEKAVIKVSPTEEERSARDAAEPKELIKVKFEKFVQLVATKDFIEVLERNRSEDIVLSANLLTELASATEEKSERKSPVIFIVGLAIGVIITYLLINK